MNFIKEKLTDDFIKKMFAIIILVIMLILLKPFKNTLLLTFIFIYLYNKCQNWIYDKVSTKMKINKKFITVLLFIATIGVSILSIIIYIPKLSHELIELQNMIIDFTNTNSNNQIVQNLLEKIRTIDYISYLKDNSDFAFKGLTLIKEITVTLFTSITLSFFYLIEIESMKELGDKISRSKLNFFYEYYKSLASKFINSFGFIIQVQILLAFINGVLSFIGLLLMGFPQSLALGFMIFVLSLIPVLGAIISAIPLIIVAFKIGGINKIIGVLVLITVLHTLENYVIKPKIMSNNIDLNTFVILLTLAIAEYFMGIWGLLIGIPLLMFFMEIFEIK